jgi:hypothetical protein
MFLTKSVTLIFYDVKIIKMSLGHLYIKSDYQITKMSLDLHMSF